MSQPNGDRIESMVDPEGFLKDLATWTPSTADRLAREHGIGPLTEDHWKVIEFVKWYYETHRTGPSAVRIHRETGLALDSICRLFPCGMVKGAYRLAGLPRPAGCA